MGWFDREENSTGVLVSRLTTDSKAVKGQFGDSMGFIMQNASTIIIAMALAFATNWQLSIVIVAASPTVVISSIISLMLLGKASAKESARIAEADGRAAEALYNLRTVSSLGIEPDMSEIYEEKLVPVVKSSQWHGIVDGLGYGVGQLFVYSMYALAFWYGGKLVVDGDANPNQILQVFLPIFLAAFGVGQAQAYFPDVSRGGAAAERVFSIVDRLPEIDNMADDGSMPLNCIGHVSFEKIRFAYPSRPNTMIFRNFNLDVPAGTSMALVGQSGSGKSTIVGLLQRYYAPLEGAVLLDNQNIATINIKWLRSQIGMVGQEPVLFNMTIRENISYGAGEVEDDAIYAAAGAAFAHDFIGKLPHGYDSIIGAGGVLLSGGQKQRIAIARAVVKNPKVRME